MKLFGREMTKTEVLQSVGHLNQVFGVHRYTLREGSADGVEALEVATGGGLRFQVLPGRGMDLGWLEYRGVPFAFIGKGGVAHAHLYDPHGAGWLKTFGGGFLVTCGLTHAGIPEVDGEEHLGLHGRISHLPAWDIQASTRWEADDLLIEVSGKVRESSLHSENLVLTRRITASAGARGFRITDTVANEGFTASALMFIHHFNLGFPLIGGESRFLAPILKTEPWEATPEAVRSIGSCCDLDDPTPGREDAVFFHDLAADERRITCMGVVNDRLGVGLRFTYSKEQFPLLSQAKIMKPQDYFMALEPGNCTPEGRARMRETGRLKLLQPQEEVCFSVAVDVVEGQGEIQALERSVAGLVDRRGK